MKFGIHLPNLSELSGRETFQTMARWAEELGFDSLWVSDHVLLPARIESPYPYSRTGAFMHDTTMVDPFLTLALVAACTERVELGLSALVAPLRNPLITARMLASLDVLAGGRVILAVGSGWLKEEFEALGHDYFTERGAVTDEWIEIFRTCWEERLPRHSGKHYRFEPLYFEPKPLRRIPIWAGGNSLAACRRAGRLCDGWHPARLRLEDWAPGIAAARRHAHAAGRDPDRLEYSMGCALHVIDGPGASPPQPTRHLIGTPGQIAEYAHALEERGVTHLAMSFMPESTVPDMLATMERFARKVRPLL